MVRLVTPEIITTAPMQDLHPQDSNLITQVADAEWNSVDTATTGVWFALHILLGKQANLEYPFFSEVVQDYFFSLVEIAGCLLYYFNILNKFTATFLKPWMCSAFVFRLFWCQPWLRFPQWLHTWTTVPKRTRFSRHRQQLLDWHGDGWGAGISFWSSEVSEEMKREKCMKKAQ